MLIKSVTVIYICSIITVESFRVDNLPKCSLSDNECMRVLYGTILRDIGKTGISELGIPPVDPINLHNVTVTVMDLITITLVDGLATGIKDCVFDKFTINITEEKGTQENYCDVTISGHYKVSALSPLIKNIFGGNNIYGDGKGKVRIEKLHLKFDFPFFAQLRDDGEIYIKCIYDNIKYDYDVLGKTQFYADNLYLGDQEISKLATSFLNENWRFVMRSFGKAFVDKAMEFYFNFASNFFDAVPTRHYISDDLTPYARKQL